MLHNEILNIFEHILLYNSTFYSHMVAYEPVGYETGWAATASATASTSWLTAVRPATYPLLAGVPWAA
jgi:hypothetical protein